MTYRIGWLSPLTPTSGVGTFSHAITRQFPPSFDGEPIDLTLLYVGHERLYRSEHRSIHIADGEDFHQILTLFDLLVYNIGNNREHHEGIFALLRLHPGIIICHDYVYQHYLADRSLRAGKSFASFAALLLTYGGETARDYLSRCRITNRLGRVRYSPWDSEASDQQPMSDAVLSLGSALVVHSVFAQHHAEACFTGPVLRLGMPHDQKPSAGADLSAWERQVVAKSRFELVSVGHIQATKCIDLVISALASSPILRRRIRYTVAGFVGDFAYFDRLKAMVATLSLQDCVSFELDVSETRLAELLQLADIFSNLRRPNTEGSSVSLIEQLDAGKPTIVINSGCYADLPADAAIKLPHDVTIRHVREALEQLIAAPASLPTIGGAGRAYARRWTCAAYARSLLKFAFANKTLLKQRANAMAIRTRLPPGPPTADRWTRDLARARRSLTYLDRNVLAVDPALVLSQSDEAICEYVAHVLFGIFGSSQLDRALSRFFVRLDARGRYWACVRFATIADGVFGDDETARERLVNMRPCYDPEFWSVIEALPARQYIAVATLILVKRLPRSDELSTTGLDDSDGFPKRLRIADLVRSLDPAPSSALGRLGRWLDASCSPALERELPTVAADFGCTVGSQAFVERIDLSGFYAMEPDHAWTRGHQGFIGLRFGRQPASVEILVRHICASANQPATLNLSIDGSTTAVKVMDCAPRLLSVEIRPGSLPSPKTIWLELSTDVTAVPANSPDTRLLGVCFLRMRVKLQSETAPRAVQSPGRVDVKDIETSTLPLAPRSAKHDASASEPEGRTAELLDEVRGA